MKKIQDNYCQPEHKASGVCKDNKRMRLNKRRSRAQLLSSASVVTKDGYF